VDSDQQRRTIAIRCSLNTVSLITEHIEREFMPYLEPADYSSYGLPDSTSCDWVTAATALINNFCRRPDLKYCSVFRAPAGHQRVVRDTA